MTLLKFGKGNAKLDKQIATFSLPAGYTCPGAQACLARANRITGKVTDGPLQQFRCFQVTSEARSPQLRAMVWHNFTLLHAARTREAMYELIQASLPNTPIVRIHIGGDFYRPEYFGAWCDVARANPGVRFYAYTKEITTWLAMQSEIPANLILTASEGGKYDDQIGALKSYSPRNKRKRLASTSITTIRTRTMATRVSLCCYMARKRSTAQRRRR